MPNMTGILIQRTVEINRDRTLIHFENKSGLLVRANEILKEKADSSRLLYSAGHLAVTIGSNKDSTALPIYQKDFKKQLTEHSEIAHLLR